MTSQKFLHLSLASPQLALRASFEAHDVAEFRRALRNGAGVNVRDRDATYSMFELACRTPGKKDFIKGGLSYGALVAEANPESGEYPIHIAASSLDSENLLELLETDRVYVDQKYEDRTALYLLFELLSGDNWPQVFECIKVLLKYRANINATNEDNVSPVALLAGGNEPWRKEVLEYCLHNYSVNVDFRRGQARKAIVKNFPSVHIPEYNMDTMTVEVLRNKLSAGTEEGFLESYEQYCAQHGEQTLQEDNRKTLLDMAVHRGKLLAAKRLVEVKLDAVGRFTGPPAMLSGLLANCCIRGNVPVLEWLLQTIPAHEVALVNEHPLLSLLVKEIDVYRDKNKCPFFRSMAILLNDARIEIDKTDGKQCSALHYAVKFKIDHAQELLLARGAYVGGEDMYGDLPICDMDPFMLEKHLDSCVSSNERKPGDEDYELKIDFSNFVPPKHKVKGAGTWQQGQLAGSLPYDDEMLPIVRMAQSSDTKRLLRHPVISSILLLKWFKLSIFFYLNLLVCTIFFVSFIFYVVFCYGRDDAPFKLLFRGLSLLGLAYLILRELIQFLLNMRVYVRSVENYMELVLIFASCSVLLHEFGDETRRVASACVILLSAVEFTLLVGTLPLLSISTHMVMLKTVSKNFLKCLVLYSIILLAFAFSFYTLFRVNGAGKANGTGTDPAAQDKADEGEDDQFNQFGEIPLALMKTAVMLTGEFEAANIKFQQSSLSYIIFALFLFFVSIVLFNLMNGLAVSDTTIIKAESELIGIIQKVFVIYKYENALKTSKPIRCITERLACLFPANSLQLFPNLVPLRYIAIKPNQSNAILIPKLVARESPDVEKGELELAKKSEADQLLQETKKFGNECCIVPCFNYNMDGKIVKYALEILHSRQENVGSIEYRVSRIEQNVDRMLQEQVELRKLLQTVAAALQPKQG